MMFLAPAPSKPLLLTSLLREQYQLGEAGSDLSCMMPQKVLGAGPLQLSCLHTSTSLESKHWERNNLKIFPPQKPDEPRRPAEVYHSRRQIKYSKDKMWYLAQMIKGMSIDQAIAQLQFNDKKGAKIMKEVLEEAQEMAVKNHNVEYKSNLYVVQLWQREVLEADPLPRSREVGIMDKVNCHYFVKLVEGSPPKVEERTSFDQAKEYVEYLKSRTIVHSL
ncbi:hypothetical protein F7725_007028 [Dissostichus mawsoni]|uniref:Large ribosomal subunit protein uL22m n=1 Tax=Dissostichus mawsoni TaxID=36200 RepID=A0A7J5XVM0_DISMA|nr:hypothetical protein F7725_007028 [Dissostichus mawsoni]